MELTGKQIKRIFFFLLFIVILMVGLNGVTPYFFRMLPNDYARTKLILNTIKDPEQAPEIVIFGNSRGMSGVDGYMLEKELSDHPVVYSFTSTGQMLSESALYYSSLPSSVKTVIETLDNRFDRRRQCLILFFTAVFCQNGYPVSRYRCFV